MTDAAQLIVAEQRLPAAQLESDLAALDLLLHPDLTFVGPDGRLSDKAADLHVHRVGTMRLDVLEPQEPCGPVGRRRRRHRPDRSTRG